MSYSYHKNYLEIINGQGTIDEKYKELKHYLHRKGYGDQAQELSFITEFFAHFFNQQHDVYEIQWQQYQDYNDNWLYFDIQELVINQYLHVTFGGFDYAELDVWEYGFDSDDLENQSVAQWSVFYNDLSEKHEHLRPNIDKILIFLRALYDYYGRYYFIYLFGRRAKVKISGNGILIDNENVDLEGGKENDEAFMVK